MTSASHDIQIEIYQHQKIFSCPKRFMYVIMIYNFYLEMFLMQ